MKKVSIIIPVYNVDRYLRRCLESVVNQNYKNIEIILINDGSTDSSHNICMEYYKKYKSIIYINQKNAGVAEVRNKGISLATGDYITFLDSDDWIDENIYCRLVQTAEETNSDIVECGFIEAYDSGKYININKYESINSFTGEKAVSENLKGNLLTVLWNKLYKRNLFIDNDIKFPNIKCFEDQVPNVKMFFYAKKVTVIPDNLVYYYQRTESLTHSWNLEINLEIINQLELIKQFLISNNLFNRYIKDFQYKFFNLTTKYIINQLYRLGNLRSYKIYNKNIKSIFEYNMRNYVINNNFSFKQKLRILLIKKFTRTYFIINKLKLL